MQRLRDYQIVAENEIRERIRAGFRRVLYVLPTGGGKTTVAASIVRQAVARGSRVVFLAHRKELIDQASARLDGLGVDHGVIMADHPRNRPWLPVQVASIQTLHRRGLPWVPDLVFVDEAHRIKGNSYQQVIADCGRAAVIGITATPCRTDGKGLSPPFETIVLGPSLSDLTAQGYLVPARTYARKKPNLAGVRTTAGDYQQDELQEAMNRPEIVGDVVAEWRKYAAGRTTAVFAVGVKHSIALRDAFRAAGVIADHLDGETPKDERERLLRDLSVGNITVLCNCGVLTEGWDCLDSQTEILTPDGWKGIGEIEKGNSSYSWNKATGEIEVTEVEQYGERAVREDEKMLVIKNQRINIRTTEGHRFYIKYRDPKTIAPSNTTLEVTGREIANRRSPYILPVSAEYPQFLGLCLTDDEIKLVAWFMTDGGFEGSAFCISQSKHHKDDIRALLLRLQIDYTERIKTRPAGGAFNENAPCHVFRIPKGTHSGSLSRNGWSKYAEYLSKDVSPLLHRMNRRQFIVFWEELLKGDGERSAEKTGWLWCDRKSQVDAYSHMAVIRGLSVRFSERITKKGKTVYRISVSDKQWLHMDSPSNPLSAKPVLVDPTKGERVWCITNKNGTIVTRRGGRIAIIGNCPSVSAVSIVRPTQSLALYLQMSGRALRPAPGKTDCVILDHGGCVYRHGLITADREWSLDGDEARKLGKRTRDAADVVKVCPDCDRVAELSDERCPCGYVFRKPRAVRQVEGELELVTEAKPISEDEKRRRYEWFLQQQMTGRTKEGMPYSPAYAVVKFRALYGHPPKRGWREAWMEKREGAWRV